MSGALAGDDGPRVLRDVGSLWGRRGLDGKVAEVAHMANQLLSVALLFFAELALVGGGGCHRAS